MLFLKVGVLMAKVQDTAEANPGARFVFPNLDGLRAFAIMPVLAAHGAYGYITGGFLGVDLFFVLSGFLITSLLYRELRQAGSISYRNFYMRRALRLLPAMVCSLLLAGALWPLTADDKSNYGVAVAAVVFYYANFIEGPVLGSLASAWSLAIEEQFYLVWPVLLLGLHRLFRGGKAPIAWCLSGAVFAVAFFRGWMFHHDPEKFDLYRFTFSRVDSLAIGALAALFVAGEAVRKLRCHKAVVTALVLAYVVAVLASSQGSPQFMYGGYTVAALLFAVLIVMLSQMEPTYVFSHPVLVWIGQRSYGIYIYHLPIFLALEKAHIPGHNLNGLFITLLRVALSFLAAELSYRYVEKPFLRLKKQYGGH